MLIGAIGVEGPVTDTFSPGTSFATIGRVGTSGGNPANNITVNPEYRLVSAIDRYAADGTLGANRSWAAAIVTYKAALPPATKLVITSVNGGSNISAGNSFSVVVQSQTESGNRANVVSDTGITLSRKSGTGLLDGTLTGTIPAGTSEVTITGVTYTKAESGVVITASRSSGDALAPGDSAAFTVDPGAATALVFSAQPVNGIAGNVIAGPPTVAVHDIFGNVVASSSATVTMAIGNNPGGSSLSGVLSVAAISGVASFGDLSLNKAGSGYTLTASSPGLTGATSSSFTISPGAAAALVFSTQPGNAILGSQLPGPPTVLVQDSLGNTVTSSSASVSIALGANPGGATLSGTTTRSAAFGIAAFNNLSLNTAANGYTLIASASGLTSATSNSFNVTAAGVVTMAALPSSIPAGDPVIVTWGTIANPTYKDWIGLFTVGSGDGSAVSGWWVNCTHSATIPVPAGTCSLPTTTNRTPGNYEFRLFTNDTFDRLATSNQITIGPPSSLNKLGLTVGPTVTAGTPGFSMTVRSLTASGSPINVVTDTAVSVTLLLGNGLLGGTLNGTILAGTDQVVIGPATYSKAESGVVLTVSRTSGDDLRAQNSSPFTVVPGPAAKLAFTAQPTNASVGAIIPGPPTVTVQDNAGNAVTSTSASIRVTLGSNPGGATLDEEMTVSFGSSVFFSSLSINQPGNGYTLVASSAGLTSATSAPFDITLPAGGGIIAGSITRVSSGAPISGALVEAFQGLALRGTAVTNSLGQYSIGALAAGSYTVRASFTGLVPQIASNVLVIDGNTTSVSLSLNFGIAIQAPVAGATINDYSVSVTGNFDLSLASEVGIQVNGYAALIDGNEFATIIPIDAQTTTVTATLTDFAGKLLASDAVPITPEPPATEPVLTFRPMPELATVSDSVGFSLVSTNEIVHIELDGNGDGTVDFSGADLEGVTVTFADPGLYYPTVRATDINSTVHTATGIVQILDISQLDQQLQSKWNAMKNALRTGDTVTAASFIVKAKQAFYQNIFNNLTISFSDIDQYLPNLTFIEQWHNAVEYEITRTEGPDNITYMVLFVRDEDGIWRIKFF